MYVKKIVAPRQIIQQSKSLVILYLCITIILFYSLLVSPSWYIVGRTSKTVFVESAREANKTARRAEKTARGRAAFISATTTTLATGQLPG